MISNDSLIIKIDGHIKRVLAKDLPTNDMFAIWNGKKWKPVFLGKVKKIKTRTIILENGLSFTATENDNYKIGDDVMINKYDNGNESSIPILGLAIGSFLINGKFRGSHTIYNVNDDFKNNTIKEFWELCGSSTIEEGDDLVICAKTAQDIIKRYIDLYDEDIKLTDGVYDTSGKFKLGFISGVTQPNNSDEWGRINKTGTVLDDYIISLIACTGLSIEINGNDIYYRSNNIVKDNFVGYHSSKIAYISELSKSENEVYSLIKNEDDTYHMLGNGILIK